MPTSAKEKAVVERHAAAETIQGDMMYFSPGQFGIKGAVSDGISRFAKRPWYAALAIPDAIVVSLSIYFLLQAFIRHTSIINGARGSQPLLGPLFNYTPVIIPVIMVGFLFYFTLVSAPLIGYAKSRIAKIKYSGIVKSVVSSVSVLQPLGYALFLGGFIAVINASSIILLTPIVTGILLYFVSISQSMLPNFLSDTNNNRSNAISHGWLLLSGSSPKVVASDLIVFSPFIVFVLAFLATHDVYALAAAAIAFVLCSGVWYGTSASIHDAVVKGKNTYNIY